MNIAQKSHRNSTLGSVTSSLSLFIKNGHQHRKRIFLLYLDIDSDFGTIVLQCQTKDSSFRQILHIRYTICPIDVRLIVTDKMFKMLR